MRPDFDDRPTAPLRFVPVETVSRFEAAELTGRLVESREEPRRSALCVSPPETAASTSLSGPARPFLCQPPHENFNGENHGGYHDRGDRIAGDDP